MALDKQQLTTLLSAVAATREDEIDCDECLAGMAEFVELELVGAEVPAALDSIRAHLTTCRECADEYQVLLDLVSAVSAETDP